MPLLTSPSEASMRDELVALTRQAQRRLEDPTLEDLALAADDVARAAAILGALNYLRAVNPFPRERLDA